MLSWGFGTFALHAFEQGTRLPEMGLRDIQGKPAALQDYVGKPLVVNLWATWCPPCRREMPVLAKAQQDNTEVNFLFVNASNQLGEFESGVTAAWWGAVPAVIVGGLGSIVIALLWMRLFPTLRDVEKLS